VVSCSTPEPLIVEREGRHYPVVFAETTNPDGDAVVCDAEIRGFELSRCRNIGNRPDGCSATAGWIKG
jgi:hypothetical protein